MQPQAKPFFFAWMIALILTGISMLSAQTTRTWEVYFDYNSARLAASEKAKLDSLPLELVESLMVSGHTDARGNEAFNEKLALRRASAVALYLGRQFPDMPPAECEVLGESAPVAPNEINGEDNPAGRQLNRRVTVAATFAAPAPATAAPAQPVPPAPAMAERPGLSDAPDPLTETQLLSPELQPFLVQTNQDQMITGKNGIVLEIPEGAFTVKGKPVEGPVIVTLIEAFSYDDMLRNRLTTVTEDGRLLETGGMFRLMVMANGVRVDSVLRQPIRVTLPSQATQDGMQVFVGGHDLPTRSVSWRLARNATFPVVARSRTERLRVNPYLQFYDERTAEQKARDKKRERKIGYYHPSYKHFQRIANSVLYASMKHPDGTRLSYQEKMEIVNSPRYRAKIRAVIAPPAYQRQLDSALSQLARWESRYTCNLEPAGRGVRVFLRPVQPTSGPGVAVSETMYSMKLSTISWINCDRFLDLPEKAISDVLVDVPVSQDSGIVSAALFLKSYRSALAGLALEGGGFVFPNLPIGTEATLVVLQEKKGQKVQASMQTFTIQQDQRMAMSVGNSDVQQVLAHLKSY